MCTSSPEVMPHSCRIPQVGHFWHLHKAMSITLAHVIMYTGHLLNDLISCVIHTGPSVIYSIPLAVEWHPLRAVLGREIAKTQSVRLTDRGVPIRLCGGLEHGQDGSARRARCV